MTLIRNDVAALVLAGGALLAFFTCSPPSEVPQLSATLTPGAIEAGGLERTYLTYGPRGLARRSLLVVVMHGSGQNNARMWSSKTGRQP